MVYTIQVVIKEINLLCILLNGTFNAISNDWEIILKGIL